MGIDPAGNSSAAVAAIANGEIDSMGSLSRSVWMMRAILEGVDTTVIDQLAQRFEENGWTELAIGRELADTVESQSPVTPDEMVNVFLVCVNRLMQGRATFHFLRWQEKSLSPEFVDRRVIIVVGAP